MQTNTSYEKRIKDIIKERGLQYKFICEKLGFEQVKFSQCMNEKRKFQVGEFLALCQFLNLNFSDFEECRVG